MTKSDDNEREADNQNGEPKPGVPGDRSSSLGWKKRHAESVSADHCITENALS